MTAHRLSLLPFLVLACLILSACGANTDKEFQGYVEGEYIYLAAPQAGYLKSLNVQRGDRVNAKQTVFAIASDPDDQAFVAAQAKAKSANEKLRNLKAPHRPSDVAILEANRQAAKAVLDLANTQLAQQESLFKQNFVSKAKIDEVRTARDQAAAQLESIKRQIASYQASLGRDAEIQSAQADWDASLAEAEQKRWLLERKLVTAPSVGEISDTYYLPGEWIAAGSPVASLLPDDHRRLRFFVPEALIAQLKMGALIEAHCDHCPQPIKAKINYISSQAEYTPPVIYSRENREKLVFRVEATPDPQQAKMLRPGLPIDVRL